MLKKIAAVLVLAAALGSLPSLGWAQEVGTYRANTTVETATAAGTGPFFTICGSATRLIRVKEFSINGSVGTAATRSTVVLLKTSTATSAGTATALTQVPVDSAYPAGSASLVNFYTALGTTGTGVGVVASQMKPFPITATVAATDFIPELVFDLDVRLRGIAECLQANFGATTTNAPTLKVGVVWTETKIN